MVAIAECRVPLPPGAAEPFAAPPPVVCGWCEGSGEEPDWEIAPIPCLACDGCGVVPADFGLPRSRTYEVRHVRYLPACGMGGSAGLLAIETAVKPTRRPCRETYQLVEFEPDGPGRAFLLRKCGARPDDPRAKREVLLGPAGCSCSCEGTEYLTSAKANQDAWEAGEEVFPTLGCKHLDAIASLINGGWFDLD